MNKNITSYSEVIKAMEKYLYNEESFSVVNKAYEYAKVKHQGQKRKSGEDYIVHLLNVAYIIATLEAGPDTIAAGFLHDTIEDCGVTFEEIENEFNHEIAELVEAVTKLKKLSNDNSEKEDFAAENHRKIFIAMAKDIRVIIIKFADRLHNMRTLYGHSDPEVEKRIARETLQVYAPISHRLGINTVKSELEDLSLKYLEPEKYQIIKNLLAAKEDQRAASLKIMYDKLDEMLNEHNIPHYLSGRVKSIYSIYKKMYVHNRSFDEIYDLQALRVITDNITRCYEILGYIHASYRPIPGRFKDYIAMPKPNMYQSLHTTIIAEDGQIFEIQIRTNEMDEIAETGVAAHWRYKENSKYSSKAEQKEIEEQLHWFRDLINITDESSDNSAKEYMAALTKDIFEANVYCLTPRGKVIELPTGSTPIDFAYRVHTKVGDSMIGATVNGILVPLSTELKTGDVVDIRTTKNPDALPNEDWIKMCKTTTAKNNIKKALSRYENEVRKDEIIADGRQQFEEALRTKKGINKNDIFKIIEDKKFLDTLGVDNVTNLYVAIANKTLSIQSILNSIIKQEKKTEVITPFDKKKTHASTGGIIVPGANNVAVSFSQCCSPIPGDEIIGYIMQGKGIKIHRKDCSTIKKSFQRTIDVYWDYDYFKECPTLHYADIVVKANTQPNLLTDIINHLSTLKINVSSANIVSNPQSMISVLTFCIQVYDLANLTDVINSIGSSIPSIFSVERTMKN